MTVAGWRRPIVYASERAQREAEKVMPGRILENEVERRLAEIKGPPSGATLVGDGWRARLVQMPWRRNRKRAAWVVTEVEPDRRRAA